MWEENKYSSFKTRAKIEDFLLVQSFLIKENQTKSLRLYNLCVFFMNLACCLQAKFEAKKPQESNMGLRKVE